MVELEALVNAAVQLSRVQTTTTEMYYGAIQICGERVGTSETKEFCEALDAHKIKMLSLRECGISTKNFKKLMDSTGYCKSILHMNLNLCGIHCQDRVDMLAAALNMNRSLSALLLHGNHFGTEGLLKIVRPLILHPTITCLDVGDCDISDRGLKSICELLPPDGDKPGLQELVLSGNPKITSRAWEKFSVALAACSTLRSLYVDFNNIGEAAGKMLIVVAASHKSLSVLDMEACDITECVARLLLYLLHHYPTCLSHVLLEENDVCEETKYAIRIALGESESDSSSSDDGACEIKTPECPPKKERKSRRRVKKADICSSDEEEVACVEVKPRSTNQTCIIKKKCFTPTSSVCTTSTKDICVGTTKRSSLKSSNRCTDSSEVEVAKLKIQLEETSDSEGDILAESNNLDVTYEFKADDIRFDFSQKPLSPSPVFDDPELEHEYQTLIADSDEEVLPSAFFENDGSDVEDMLPQEAQSDEFKSSRDFIRTMSDSEDSLSELDLTKKKASSLFGRRSIY
ncbi:LRRC73 [Bugula neritina]|uniref:LRRC73 n=1 Tax=Bugula neritina TaxID=10212 RepID=A0A7J7J5H0_BUGNE|nr:LRRC73 [Bugula neritina]